MARSRRRTLVCATAATLVGAIALAAASAAERPARPRPLPSGRSARLGANRAPRGTAGAAPATTPARPGPTAAESSCPSGRPIHEHLVTRPRWLHGVAITEYYSAPERWAVGRLVSAPGIPGRHRVDWLYSATGMAMEGDGIGLDGRHFHIDAVGSGGWMNAGGQLTLPGRCASHWSRGAPVWLQGGWRNGRGAVTFPLEGGGWSAGRGTSTRSYLGVTFAPGSSLPLHPYRTLAVDPGLIPLGSRVYIPAYGAISGGWFVAEDTGGGIIGHHVDVYRPPPATPGDGGRYLQAQRIYVVPPGVLTPPGARLPAG